MTATRHIAIICSRLDEIGGYEKIVPETANLFAANGNKVTLVIMGESPEIFHPVDKAVTIVRKNLNFGISNKGNIFSRKIKFLADITVLRRTINSLKADIIIAAEYHFSVAAILAKRKSSAKIISWEHTPYATSEKNRFWKKMFLFAYPKLNGIVCLNNAEKKIYEQLNNFVATIPNFVGSPGTLSPQTNKQIITVARLEAIKGIDFLLPVAHTVLTKHPDWKWLLIGNGELKNSVLTYIANNNLNNKLLLLAPEYKDLTKFYTESSVYVCTSRYESFGLTIAEAMSCGLPAISFDCNAGPRNIITNNEDGLLSEKENPEKLAAAITTLIGDEARRIKMGEKAAQNIQRFSPGTIYSLWEKLFEKLLS